MKLEKGENTLLTNNRPASMSLNTA